MKDLSRLTRKWLVGDDKAWCAHAWANQDKTFWRVWVAVFGKGHCERSWRRYL